jgi:uncharacterized membrane protein YqgA involved in biofilm formation
VTLPAPHGLLRAPILAVVDQANPGRPAASAGEAASQPAFVEGFVLASLVACVGPLAVLAPLATGLLAAAQ